MTALSALNASKWCDLCGLTARSYYRTTPEVVLSMRPGHVIDANGFDKVVALMCSKCWKKRIRDQRAAPNGEGER